MTTSPATLSILIACDTKYRLFLPAETGCLLSFITKPNAGAHLLPEAGAQRTLEAVRCTPWFGPALVKDIGFPQGLPQIAPLTTSVVEELHALPYEEALCGAPDKPNCTRTARSTCCMSRAETLPMRLMRRVLLTVVS
jgi:hypothetical protein